MYQDLKDYYWWPRLKSGVALYVGKCLTSAKVKVGFQKSSGLLQQLEIPMWKWEQISIDFMTKLPRTPRGHDTIWVIMDRLTKFAYLDYVGQRWTICVKDLAIFSRSFWFSVESEYYFSPTDGRT
ncbi:putative nucleotidyltransferase, Ribonuclease H [Helianthus annuus]|nr:putative nucleotidyltransferase, Ribonuclease H [Helianthus annuus]